MYNSWRPQFMNNYQYSQFFSNSVFPVVAGEELVVQEKMKPILPVAEWIYPSKNKSVLLKFWPFLSNFFNCNCRNEIEHVSNIK